MTTDPLSLRTLCIAKMVNEGFTQGEIDAKMGTIGYRTEIYQVSKIFVIKSRARIW